MSPTSEQIEIRVNGERRGIASGISLEELLKSLNIRPDRVAIEMNRRIVSRTDWGAAAIPGDAEIEIVQFVGGG
jgi:thiamine biosynthesis protein ThiS